MAAKKDGVITKLYLDKRLGKFKTELKTELRTGLKHDIREFKDEIKNEFYDIKDEIVGEIKNMREEFNTHQFSHRRINEEIQEHDKRIRHLETPPAI